jgi:anti-sigma factor RsiW
MTPWVRWRRVRDLLASWRSRLASTHLTDRELVRIVVDAEHVNGTAREAHLAACERCAARVATLREDLDRITTTAEAGFDEALPAWRLVRQRRRILDRIHRAASRPGSARILRFPALGTPVASSAYPIRRWLPLAAAAGLLVTVGLGQLVDGQPDADPQPPSAAAPARAAIGPPGGQPQSAADEQLMRELDDALNSSRVRPLMALDEMTPRVRAAAIDVR